MAERRSHGKKPLVLGLAAGLTLAGSGVAFAYWTSTGSGTGGATTGTSTAFVITADPPAGGPLSPDGPTQTVAYTVTNPNGAGVQTLTGTTVAIAGAGGASWTTVPGCSAADYTATITTAPAYAVMQPGDTATGEVTVQMIDTGVDQDACQGAAVPLYFTAA